MLSKDQRLLEEAYASIQESNTASDVQKGFQVFTGGIKDAAIKRIAVLASQGRRDEADQSLRVYIKDPAKLKSVLAWMDQNLKPIPSATSSKLEDNAPYQDWLLKHWVPFVQRMV